MCSSSAMVVSGLGSPPPESSGPKEVPPVSKLDVGRLRQNLTSIVELGIVQF